MALLRTCCAPNQKSTVSGAPGIEMDEAFQNAAQLAAWSTRAWAVVILATAAATAAEATTVSLPRPQTGGSAPPGAGSGTQLGSCEVRTTVEMTVLAVAKSVKFSTEVVLPAGLQAVAGDPWIVCRIAPSTPTPAPAYSVLRVTTNSSASQLAEVGTGKLTLCPWASRSWNVPSTVVLSKTGKRGASGRRVWNVRDLCPHHRRNGRDPKRDAHNIACGGGEVHLDSGGVNPGRRRHTPNIYIYIFGPGECIRAE